MDKFETGVIATPFLSIELGIQAEASEFAAPSRILTAILPDLFKKNQ